MGALTAFGSYITCSTLRMYFNDDYTDCRLYLYMFGFIPFPSPMRWTMTDISPGRDGSLWDRGIYILGCRSRFSYQLRKIIDGKGEHLPAFKEMCDTLWSS